MPRRPQIPNTRVKGSNPEEGQSLTNHTLKSKNIDGETKFVISTGQALAMLGALLSLGFGLFHAGETYNGIRNEITILKSDVGTVKTNIEEKFKSSQMKRLFDGQFDSQYDKVDQLMERVNKLEQKQPPKRLARY